MLHVTPPHLQSTLHARPRKMGMIQKQALENAEQTFSEWPLGEHDSKAWLLKNAQYLATFYHLDEP